MSTLRRGDEHFHYTGGSHRWVAPTLAEQQSWEIMVRAHVEEHRRGRDRREDMAAMLAAAGITVTEAGRARARAELDAVGGERNREQRTALRERLKLAGSPARRSS